MSRRIGAHWLAFMGGIPADARTQLTAAVKTAKKAGCSTFELACAPVNGLSADDTAEAVLEGGMDTVSFCRFFPGGQEGGPPPCGDPLADGPNFDAALATMEADLAFILRLRKKGLTVPYVTGPWAFVLGQTYPYGREEMRERLDKFVDRQGVTGASHQLTYCLEYLRPGEDMEVIAGIDEACALLDRVNHPNVMLHGDTFHMLQRKEEPWRAILKAGKRLGYLHAHGTDRGAPGSYKLDGVEGATDTVNWHLVACALQEIEYNGWVVAEPFGEQIREQVPALGEGLPPAIDPRRYYDFAVDHFRRNGVI